MMEYGNMIINILLVVYTYQFWQMKKIGWNNLKAKTEQMNELRSVPIKSLEEQKAFLDMKFPKSIPTKKTFKYWSKIVGSILMGICVYMFYNLVLNFFNIKTPLWLALVILFLGPLLITMFLNRLGVDNGNDIFDILLRRNKK